MTVPTIAEMAVAQTLYGDLPAADSAYFAAAAGGHLIISGRGALLGWSVHSTSGVTPSLVYVRDGTDGTGEIIAISRVNVNIEESVPIPWPGVFFGSGLFVSDASGLAEGVLWFVAL